MNKHDHEDIQVEFHEDMALAFLGGTLLAALAAVTALGIVLLIDYWS